MGGTSHVPCLGLIIYLYEMYNVVNMDIHYIHSIYTALVKGGSNSSTQTSLGVRAQAEVLLIDQHH